MVRCKYCSRDDFRNQQAVRGHYRACPKKPRAGLAAESQLNRQEPGIGSAVEPGSAGSDKAEISLPTRSTLSSNYLLRMIEAHDLLAILRKRVHGRLWYYKLRDTAGVRDTPLFQDWRQVAIDLLRCEREVGELVPRVSVSRDRVWAVYQQVIDVQDRWIPWAEWEVEQIWSKREKGSTMTRVEQVVEYGLPELMDQFTRLLDLLRRLTAMTRLGI